MTDSRPSIPLAPCFLRHLTGSPSEGGSSEELEGQLEEALEAARAQWPGVEVDPEDYLQFLARRVPEDVQPAIALAGLRTGDLYLACACLVGTPGSARAFKDAYFPMLDRALPGVCQEASQVDDIKQAVYQKVFVGEGDHNVAIHKYNGIGDLRAWLRVTAVRMALNLRRGRKKERPLSPQILVSVPEGSSGPEEDYFKRYYSDAFKKAFQQALRTLPPEQRNLLRYYYIDGLTVDQIGRIYRVHKATISRRLADIRELLLTETRNALVRELDVGQPEFESIMRLIQSRLDVSICRFLKPD